MLNCNCSTEFVVAEVEDFSACLISTLLQKSSILMVGKQSLAAVRSDRADGVYMAVARHVKLALSALSSFDHLHSMLRSVAKDGNLVASREAHRSELRVRSLHVVVEAKLVARRSLTLTS